MKKLLLILALIGLFSAPALAGSWSFGAVSCGSAPAPSGSIASGAIGLMQIIAVSGTVGGGTVSSCQINLATDGTVVFDTSSTPSCIAVDQTGQTVLGVAFSAALSAQPFSYGSVTLTSPGAANMAGHKIAMWCTR